MSPVRSAGPRTGTTGAAQSPLMEQYARVKAEHPDAFLFFRLGDFYEMFFEDAVEGAALLGLTLTSRNKHDPDPIPMCGVPWHQRDAYIARLLRLGRKVAVCDQVEEASQAKGLVQRAVTEILTPGSVTGEEFLETAANNFLAALWPGEDRLGVCLADASTGEIKLAEVDWIEAPGWLSRRAVAEWLIPHGLDDAAAERLEAALRGLGGAVSPVPAARFTAQDGVAALPERLGVETAGTLADLPLAARALAAALDYLDRMAGGRARQLTRIERWLDEHTLRYDAATARHLELFQPQPGGEVAHTLWRHLNLSATAPGGRRLRGWLERPLTDLAVLARRHDQVGGWLETGTARAELRESLAGLPDLERLAARLACAKATPRDLGALRGVLLRLPAIAAPLAGLAPDRVALAGEPLAGFEELERLLGQALVDDPPVALHEGGIMRPGYDPVRDQLDDLAHSGKRWIADLEAAERVRSGIGSLKIGFNRVFGYYLEVTRPHLDKVPADFERRQTLTTAERFVTPELKAKESEVLGAEEKLEAREHELFIELRERAAAFVPALRGAADTIAELDAHAALAEAAARFGWTRPSMSDSDRMVLEGACNGPPVRGDRDPHRDGRACRPLHVAVATGCGLSSKHRQASCQGSSQWVSRRRAGLRDRHRQAYKSQHDKAVAARCKRIVTLRDTWARVKARGKELPPTASSKGLPTS